MGSGAADVPRCSPGPGSARRTGFAARAATPGTLLGCRGGRCRAISARKTTSCSPTLLVARAPSRHRRTAADRPGQLHACEPWRFEGGPNARAALWRECRGGPARHRLPTTPGASAAVAAWAPMHDAAAVDRRSRLRTHRPRDRGVGRPRSRLGPGRFGRRRSPVGPLQRRAGAPRGHRAANGKHAAAGTSAQRMARVRPASPPRCVRTLAAGPAPREVRVRQAGWPSSSGGGSD
jgi:hypothetical protein